MLVPGGDGGLPLMMSVVAEAVGMRRFENNGFLDTFKLQKLVEFKVNVVRLEFNNLLSLLYFAVCGQCFYFQTGVEL